MKALASFANLNLFAQCWTTHYADPLISKNDNMGGVPTDYLACGIKISYDGWSNNAFSQAQIIGCREDDWSSQSTTTIKAQSSSGWNTVMCPTDYYMTGINSMVDEGPFPHRLSEDLAYTTARYGGSPSYSIDGMAEGSQPDYNDFRIGSPNGFKDKCVNKDWGFTALETIMPNYEIFAVRKVYFSRRADAPTPELHDWVVYHAKIDDHPDDWVYIDKVLTNSDPPTKVVEIPQSSDWETNVLKIYFRAYDCITGRFDLEVLRKYPPLMQTKITCESKNSPSTSQIENSCSGTLSYGTWNTPTLGGQNQFISALNMQSSNSGGGFYGIQVEFKEYSCKYDLESQTVSDIVLPIQTVMNDNTQNNLYTDTYVRDTQLIKLINSYRCPIISCGVRDMSTGSAPSTSEIWLEGTDSFKINRDPVAEFDRNVQVFCSNKYGETSTNTFQIKIYCPDTIQIWLPSNIQIEQKYPATTVISSRSTFKFSKFETSTIACPVDSYRVFQSETVQKVPNGIDVTRAFVPNHDSSDPLQFEIPVLDGENPQQFKFVIQAIARGGAVWYSPELTLTTYCPSPPVFTLPTYQTTFRSYLFASDPSYTFGQTIPVLPKCDQITEYEIQPSSSYITYPSSSCNTSPCLTLEFDVTQTRVITFLIRPKGNSVGTLADSPTITITITENEVLPTITQSSLANKQVLIDSNEVYEFQKFSLDSNGYTIIYQISSDGSSIVPINGVTGPSYNAISNKYEISFPTSSILTTTFYIKAHLNEVPSIFLFSNSLTFSVTCGSETIITTVSKVTISAYPPSSSPQSYSFNARSFFSSSKATHCDLFSISSSSSLFSSASIESNTIGFQENSGKTQSIMVTASTPGQTKTLEFVLTVCGEETVERKQEQTTVVGGQVELVIDKYFTYSGVRHQECVSRQTIELLDEQCNGPLPAGIKFTIQTDKVVFDTSSPFLLTKMCLQVETLGKVKQNQILNVEILGGEKISLNHPQGVLKKYFAEANQTINIETEGFIFTSESAYAPITGYQLFDATYRKIQTYTSQQIVIYSAKPLTWTKYYLAAFTGTSSISDYLQIELKICGKETISLKQSYVLSSYKVAQNPITIPLKTYFSSDDTDCHITQYDLFFPNKSEFSNSSLYILDSNLFVNPKNFKTGTVELLVRAKSLGSIEKYLPWTFEFTKNLSPQGDIAPYFYKKAGLFNIRLEYDSSGMFNPYANFNNDEYLILPKQLILKLPLIVDPNKIGIKLITQVEVFFGTHETDLEPIPKPNWLRIVCQEKCSDQLIGFEYKQSIKGPIQQSDGGLYKIQMVLENEQRNKRVDHIFVALQVIDYHIQSSLDFASSAKVLEDINFKIRFGLDDDPCTAFKEITLFEVYCVKSNFLDPIEAKYCDDVLIYCFKVALPQKKDDLLVDDTLNTDQEGIEEQESKIESLYAKFDAVSYFQLQKLWLKNGNQGIETEQARKIVMSAIKYKIQGITPENEFCQHEQLLTKHEEKTQSADNFRAAVFGFTNSDFWKAILQSEEEEVVIVKKKDNKIRSKVQKVNFIQKGYDQFLIDIKFTKSMVKLEKSYLDRLYGKINIRIQGKELQTSQIGRKLQLTTQEISWELSNQTDQNLLISGKFSNPQSISQIPPSRDKLIISIERNSILIDSEYRLPLEFDKDFSITLNQYRVPPDNPISKDENIIGFQALILLIESNILILNIIFSKSLQDILSFLGAQQITIHMMLLGISGTGPGNIYTYYQQLSHFIQKDMYPTDQIFAYFGFTESETPVEQFEDLGYEGANFLELSGSLIINFCIAIVCWVFYAVTLKLSKIFYRYEYARVQGIKLQGRDDIKAILDLYLQGYLEVFISFTISMSQIQVQSLNQSKGDIMALSFAGISLVILIILPFMIIYQAWVKFKEGSSSPLFDFLFEEISINSFGSAIFNFIFIARRAVFALLLIFMNEFVVLQLILHILLTLAYALYIVNFKPLQSSLTFNNELSVLILSYLLLALCSDSITSDQRFDLGYFYIGFSLLNVLYNLRQTLQEVLTVTIPLLRQKRKIQNDYKNEQKQIQEWLQNKERRSELSPEGAEMYEYAKVMVKVHQLKKEYSVVVNKYNQQMRWLKDQGLDVSVMLKQMREIHKIQIELKENIIKCKEVNQEKGIRLGESMLGIGSLILSFETVKKGEYYHNRDEKKGSNLREYLHFNGYRLRKIKDDGNKGPRAIGLQIYGSQGAHQRVRREICQYVLCNSEFWGDFRLGPEMKYAYETYVNEMLSKSGEPFTPTEYLAAAKLYDLPIVLFWSKNPQVLPAYTLEGNKKDPLYLHKKGILIHRDQKTQLGNLKKIEMPNQATARFEKPQQNLNTQLEAIEEKDEEYLVSEP